MKKIFGVIALMLMFSFASQGAENEVKLTTANDSLSYFYGKMVGYGVSGDLTHGPDSARVSKDEVIKGMKVVLDADTSNIGFLRGLELGNAFKSMMKGMKQRDNVDLNEKLFLDEFYKAFLDKKAQNPQEYQGLVMQLMTKMSDDAKAKVAAENKQKEEAFFKELLKDSSVKKTDSGVCYKVIAAGDGKVFNPADKILVKYEGKHINGDVFDKSKDGPVPMTPGHVIPGFGEVLKIMSPGAHYIIYIPADQAYGNRGAGPIKPGETLIFDVETTGVMPAEPKAEVKPNTESTQVKTTPAKQPAKTKNTKK